jgi:hypothetical protein
MHELAAGAVAVGPACYEVFMSNGSAAAPVLAACNYSLLDQMWVGSCCQLPHMTLGISHAAPQVPSSAASSPAASVPRAARDKLLRQALPCGQEHVLMGHASPGPCCPQTSSLGRQIVSCWRSLL